MVISAKYGQIDIPNTVFIMTKYREPLMKIEGSSYGFSASIYLEFKKRK